jgi:hypothetical protein
MKSGITVAAQGTTHTSITRTRFAARALVSGATVVAFVGLAGVPAFADTGATSATESTDANVVVTSGITLDAIDDFTLTGLPGETVDEAVGYRVTTNAGTGYNVTVRADADNLETDPASADDIDIDDLTVNSTAAPTVFNSVPGPLGTPRTLHTQGARSAANGDAQSNTYRILIPAVAPATYTVTLDYVATINV